MQQRRQRYLRPRHMSSVAAGWCLHQRRCCLQRGRRSGPWKHQRWEEPVRLLGLQRAPRRWSWRRLLHRGGPRRCGRPSCLGSSHQRQAWCLGSSVWRMWFGWPYLSWKGWLDLWFCSKKRNNRYVTYKSMPGWTAPDRKPWTLAG